MSEDIYSYTSLSLDRAHQHCVPHENYYRKLSMITSSAPWDRSCLSQENYHVLWLVISILPFSIFTALNLYIFPQCVELVAVYLWTGNLENICHFMWLILFWLKSLQVERWNEQTESGSFPGPLWCRISTLDGPALLVPFL
jgi:hypothetical protein